MGGGILAAQLLAQASGFGVFMMASSIVGGLTSAVGITLPFAFYTSMSSVIATVINPFFLAIPAAVLAASLFRSDMSQTKVAIFYFASFRMKMATHILKNVASDYPGEWLDSLADCHSLEQVTNLRIECEDCEPITGSAPGYGWVIGTIHVLVHGEGGALRATIIATRSENLVATSKAALTHCRRLAPGKVDVLYCAILIENVPDELIRLRLEERDLGALSYHTAYFRVARRIAELMR